MQESSSSSESEVSDDGDTVMGVPIIDGSPYVGTVSLLYGKKSRRKSSMKRMKSTLNYTSPIVKNPLSKSLARSRSSSLAIHHTPQSVIRKSKSLAHSRSMSITMSPFVFSEIKQEFTKGFAFSLLLSLVFFSLFDTNTIVHCYQKKNK